MALIWLLVGASTANSGLLCQDFAGADDVVLLFLGRNVHHMLVNYVRLITNTDASIGEQGVGK